MEWKQEWDVCWTLNNPDNEQDICIWIITFKPHNGTARQVAFDVFWIWDFWPRDVK